MTTAAPTRAGVRLSLDGQGLDRLIAALRDQGHEVLGPCLKDGAIVLDTLSGSADLPAGWTDVQEAGHYRVAPNDGPERFAHVLPATPLKRFLHPPEARLVTARREQGTVRFEGHDPAPRLAFLGVRACELAAIAVQDRVLLQGPWADPVYRGRREAAFLVAVQCTRLAPTCFCASMGTGPRVHGGADVVLTEVRVGERATLVAEAGSERGEALLAALALPAAGDEEAAAADAAVARAEGARGRTLETAGLPEALAGALEHPRWEDVAARCLACGNCTQVCPTCFCVTLDEAPSLAGDRSDRVRRWDSCFNVEFSYIHGGSVRSSVRSRYRQWLTHKLGTWHEQFGSSGCVGCGRCITWCPAGIDLTEEVRALRSPERRKESGRADA